MKSVIKGTLLFVCVFLFTSLANAQSTNLLKNPKADEGPRHWRVYGDAKVEQTDDGNSRFVVRNKGYFLQDVILPPDSVGKYALLIGRVSSQRNNADGSITGLPNLYGYMMVDADPRGGRVLSYLQGQQMTSSATKENEWVTAWGVFPVPSESGAIRFFLNQAEQRGRPQNGSAARFDDLGLYLFASEDQAKAFATGSQGGAPGKFGTGIAGRITDRNGAVVLGARIRILARTTSAVVFRKSNDAGEYVADLNPDVYDVEVDAEGFKKTTRKSIPVLREGRSHVDFVLEVNHLTRDIRD